MAERARDRRGRFIRKMRQTPADLHCWLIWSKKWNCWHRRSAEGGACGYTGDLADAGLFPRAKAAAYHDGIDNEAFHVSEQVEHIGRQIGTLRNQIDMLEKKAAAARQIQIPELEAGQ
ncbi:hypothetical protein GGR39_002387 [Novosphingobium fluoreni]|uniref:Uncharacterized protein n=1 Tax=Novosphingobium fluoreni TaxID=1391222 RepID=A0A7W6C236_9SPHN|nr:hypothetical protein [Novosphingobium fluoreni]MBB3940730.1 hypothetical protein [Novosphingobium fluoreni]